MFNSISIQFPLIQITYKKQSMSAEILNNPDPSKKHLMRLQQLLTTVRGQVQANVYKIDHNLPHKENLMRQPKSLAGGDLKEYQLQALNWMITLSAGRSNAILADDMGLGKTIQAISFFAYIYEEYNVKGKHFVVCPKSVMHNWKREINKWLPQFRAQIFVNSEQQRPYFITNIFKPRKFDILITNYEGAKSNINLLKRVQWETLIVDEAHKIKNFQSQIFLRLKEYKADFKLLLTGTPLSNNLRELWSLLNFIMPDIFDDVSFFDEIETSANQFQGSEQEKVKYKCQIAKYFHQIIRPFFKRRTKKELELNLPQKFQKTIFVPLTERQLKMYKNYLKTGNVYGIQDHRDKHAMQPRKICNHPYLFPPQHQDQQYLMDQQLINSCGKLKILDLLIKKLVNQGHKILIFSQFKIMLNILEDYCGIRGYKMCRLDGDTKFQQRQAIINEFSTNPEIPIFILTTKTGGIGINLTAADRVIIYDIDWNPQIDLQATDRAYRIGQTRPVHVYKFITEHTIEERMLQFQKYKLIWNELVIQKGNIIKNKSDDPFANFNFNDLKDIGRGQIYRLEVNKEDTRTIQEILQVCEKKDLKKNEQIMQKLKETIEAGAKINPFKQNEEDDSQDTSMTQHIQINMQKQKFSSRERIKFQRMYIIPEYKFYQNLQQIKEIQYQIYMEQKYQLNELKRSKIISILNQNLQKIKDEERFQLWTKQQFLAFVEAHKTMKKGDYYQISLYIQSKSEVEVQDYSQFFFENAEDNRQLTKVAGKIQVLQRRLDQSAQEQKDESFQNRINSQIQILDNEQKQIKSLYVEYDDIKKERIQRQNNQKNKRKEQNQPEKVQKQQQKLLVEQDKKRIKEEREKMIEQRKLKREEEQLLKKQKRQEIERIRKQKKEEQALRKEKRLQLQQQRKKKRQQEERQKKERKQKLQEARRIKKEAQQARKRQLQEKLLMKTKLQEQIKAKKIQQLQTKYNLVSKEAKMTLVELDNQPQSSQTHKKTKLKIVNPTK